MARLAYLLLIIAMIAASAFAFGPTAGGAPDRGDKPPGGSPHGGPGHDVSQWKHPAFNRTRHNGGAHWVGRHHNGTFNGTWPAHNGTWRGHNGTRQHRGFNGTLPWGNGTFPVPRPFFNRTHDFNGSFPFSPRNHSRPVGPFPDFPGSSGNGGPGGEEGGHGGDQDGQGGPGGQDDGPFSDTGKGDKPQNGPGGLRGRR